MRINNPPQNCPLNQSFVLSVIIIISSSHLCLTQVPFEDLAPLICINLSNSKPPLKAICPSFPTRNRATNVNSWANSFSWDKDKFCQESCLGICVWWWQRLVDEDLNAITGKSIISWRWLETQWWFKTFHTRFLTKISQMGCLEWGRIYK